MISTGTIVEIRRSNKSQVALCLNCEKNKVRLLLINNKEISLDPQKVLFPSKNPLDMNLPREELLKILRDTQEEREQLKAEIPLEELWLLLAEEEGTSSAEEIAELNFGENPTQEKIAIVYRALSDDFVFFKNKKNEFYPNSAENVEKTQQMLKGERDKKERNQKVVKWIKTIWKEGKTTDIDSDIEAFIAKLKHVAITKEESRTHKAVNELLAEAGMTGQNLPFRLLVKSGIWDEDENLDIYINEVPVKFSSEVLEESENIIKNFILKKEERLDLTHLYTFTIDSEHTKDMDDALSISRTEKGYRAGIHIIDVAEYIKPGTILDREGQARATSLYMPEEKISMFPENLSTKFFSLIKGEARPAISVIVDFDSDFSMIDYEIKETVIEVKERMTYEEATRLIEEGQEDFLLLHKICTHLKEKRKEKGALFFYIPDLEITIDENKEIKIKICNREGPANTVVSEMMIIANELSAKLCKENSIPLIYRSQPELQEELTMSGKYDPVKFYQERKLLKKSEATTYPLYHYGLGVEAYTQLTSPIRRYTDLVSQRQLKSFIKKGTYFYNAEELEKIIMASEVGLDAANNISRKRKRYWLLKYMSSLTGENIKAIVLEKIHDKLVLILKDYLLELTCNAPLANFAPGDEIEVKIQTSIPREDIIKVSIV